MSDTLKYEIAEELRRFRILGLVLLLATMMFLAGAAFSTDGVPDADSTPYRVAQIAMNIALGFYVSTWIIAERIGGIMKKHAIKNNI